MLGCNVATVVTAPTSDRKREYAAKVVSVIGVTSARRRSRPVAAEWMQRLKLWALAGAYGIRKPPSLALIRTHYFKLALGVLRQSHLRLAALHSRIYESFGFVQMRAR